MQNAFVVTDLDAALDHWTRVMGVGPFFVFERVEFAEIWYRGQSALDIDLSVAIGYWGDLQIELIRQRNDVPSIYTDFPGRQAGGRGAVRVWSVGTVAGSPAGARARTYSVP